MAKCKWHVWYISPPATRVSPDCDKPQPDNTQTSHQLTHQPDRLPHCQPAQSSKQPSKRAAKRPTSHLFFFTAIGRVKYPPHVLLQPICISLCVSACVCASVFMLRCYQSWLLVWIVADSAVSCWVKNCATLTLQLLYASLCLPFPNLPCTGPAH